VYIEASPPNFLFIAEVVRLGLLLLPIKDYIQILLVKAEKFDLIVDTLEKDIEDLDFK